MTLVEINEVKITWKRDLKIHKETNLHVKKIHIPHTHTHTNLKLVDTNEVKIFGNYVCQYTNHVPSVACHVCCSVLQRVAAYCSVLQCESRLGPLRLPVHRSRPLCSMSYVLQCVAVYCSVL